MALQDLVPIINNVSYAHADIKVNILGADIVGITSIEYGDTQAITPNYSTGHDPTSVGFGQNAYTASVTMTYEAMMTIQRVAPQGKIQNIPFFPIGVNMAAEGQPLVRDILRRCRFTGRQLSSESGNSEIPVTMELFVAKIDYNV